MLWIKKPAVTGSRAVNYSKAVIGTGMTAAEREIANKKAKCPSLVPE